VYKRQLHIDSDDIDALCMALHKSIADNEWRTQIIADALLVARSYTWDRCLHETMAVYRQLT
jgi:hypothetical protein